MDNILSKYTDDDLRNELKRRAKERRKLKGNKYEIIYKSFEGTIKKINKSRIFREWEFILTDIDSELLLKSYPYVNDFKLKQGLFTKSNHPNIGDRVKVMYRRTKSKSEFEIFDIRKGKIVEIL